MNQYLQKKLDQLKLDREAAAIESLKEQEAYRKLKEITERVNKLVDSSNKEEIKIPVKSTDV